MFSMFRYSGKSTRPVRGAWLVLLPATVGLFLAVGLRSADLLEGPGRPPEIHCRHFIYGYPLGAPRENDLIIRDIYALSSNDRRKFADWVAYRLDAELIRGPTLRRRIFRPDPWLEPEETLENEDYRGAYRLQGLDRGHLAPLASFRGAKNPEFANYLSNIAPQKARLNRGPWKKLESRTRRLTRKYRYVYVMTGPLYERRMPFLPGADEYHRVPSGFWKIVFVQPEAGLDSIRLAGFIFDQETPGKSPLYAHLVTVAEIQRRSGLDFFRELPDVVERRVERKIFAGWAVRHFH